jgi:DNA-directed RNA polymerase subunit F
MSKTIPTTIELNKTALKNLTEMAKANGKTVSEVINDLLSFPSQKKQTVNPLLGIIGIASTGLGDAAQNHDAYLYEEASSHK